MGVNLNANVTQILSDTKNIDKYIEDTSIKYSVDRNIIKEFIKTTREFLTSKEKLGELKGTINSIRNNEVKEDNISEDIHTILKKISSAEIIRLIACNSASYTTTNMIYETFKEELLESIVPEFITKTGENIVSIVTDMRKEKDKFYNEMSTKAKTNIKTYLSTMARFINTGKKKEKIKSIIELIKVYASKGQEAAHKFIETIADLFLKSILLLTLMFIVALSISSIILLIISIITTTSLLILFVLGVGKMVDIVEDGESEEDIEKDIEHNLTFDNEEYAFESIRTQITDIHEADEEDKDFNYDEELEKSQDEAKDIGEPDPDEGEDGSDMSDEPYEEKGKEFDPMGDTGDEFVDSYRKEEEIKSLKNMLNSCSDALWEFRDTDIYKDNEELYEDVVSEYELTNENLRIHIQNINNKKSVDIRKSVIEFKNAYIILSKRIEEITDAINKDKNTSYTTGS